MKTQRIILNGQKSHCTTCSHRGISRIKLRPILLFYLTLQIANGLSSILRLFVANTSLFPADITSVSTNKLNEDLKTNDCCTQCKINSQQVPLKMRRMWSFQEKQTCHSTRYCVSMRNMFKKHMNSKLLFQKKSILILDCQLNFKEKSRLY